MSSENWRKPNTLWKKVTSGGMPSRTVLVPLTRWPTGNYPQTRHHCENPELGNEAEAPPPLPYHRDRGGAYEKRSSYPLTTSLLSQAAEHCTQWGKKSPRWTFSSLSTKGHFPGGPFPSCLTGTTGEIFRSSTLEHQRDGEGVRGLQQPALRLGGSHSHLW